ncbi:hypothetical protein SynA15127_02363 [Synechococcus sp. A15-127]|nr:hypothetical protein SynA15127_02363 [Synechococcus sp. A15-127]
MLSFYDLGSDSVSFSDLEFLEAFNFMAIKRGKKFYLVFSIMELLNTFHMG